jgi:hypothetical protein
VHVKTDTNELRVIIVGYFETYILYKAEVWEALYYNGKVIIEGDDFPFEPAHLALEDWPAFEVEAYIGQLIADLN